MNGDCRPDPTRPRPDAAEQTADYLYRIARCPCLPQWQQPGGLCGGCGRDEFGVVVDEVHNEIKEEEKAA